jgi:3-hydroxyisobutyrate dehydrogenase-like beta-hydroxyacid dehydrogenase
MSTTIGIIGLGRVGLPAAEAYIKAGYSVVGYDTRSERVSEFSKIGGKPAQSLRDVANSADVILVIVLNDVQALDATTGERGILSAAAVSTVICMSTITRNALERIWKKCEEKNIDFIDCPFTGGPARIATHSLTLIAAGNSDVLDRMRPILNVIGKIIPAGSTPGMGQAIKHCNQLLVGVTQAATMEVITLAKKMNLDPALVAQVVGSGIAGSDYFRLLADSVINKKPSPGGLGQMAKDMSIVKDTLKEVGFGARVARAAQEYFAAASEQGMDDREGADLITIVDELGASGNRTH